MLTKLPFFKFIRLVSFKVWGIIVISKLFFLTFETVKDTPLIDIEPFSTMNL